MDTVAENLANAETTRTEEGLPYRRQRAAFAEASGAASRTTERGRQCAGGRARTVVWPAPIRRTSRADVHAAPTGGREPEGVEVAVGVSPEASDFKIIFEPGHPDADPDGYVLLPNVNPITEMVDLITATRAYEANVSAVQAAKDMFSKALEI